MTKTVLGLVVTAAGLAISVMSLTLTTNNTVRLVLVLAGIAVSLFGIIGIVNRVYLNKALWRLR